jgi:hypothetical protein
MGAYCTWMIVGHNGMLYNIIVFLLFCMFHSGVIVLFCVLFVFECVLENCHRDIGVLFDYPN